MGEFNILLQKVYNMDESCTVIYQHRRSFTIILEENIPAIPISHSASPANQPDDPLNDAGVSEAWTNAS